METHGAFSGLHEVGSTEAAVLLTVIHDILPRINISIRGQCYDGASSMSGAQQGVATVISSKKNLEHCTNIAMDRP